MISRTLRVAGLAAVALCLLLPSTSWAMRTLSSDVGDADPCAALGDKGGVLVKRNIAGSESPRPVDVKLQCSPKMEMPFGTLIANDIVAKHYGGNHRGEPFFRGDLENDGDYAWQNTVGTPYIHGNIAEALRLQQFQGTRAVVDALIAAGASAASSIAVSVIVCAVGGVPSLGIACAAIPAAIGGAVVAAVGGAITSVIKAFLTAQYNRYSAMADADWFIWSDTKMIWNSFGDITDTWINPSITNFNANPLRTDHIRIGVQFSTVPVGQGAEYFSAKENGGAPRAAAAGGPDASIAQLSLGQQLATGNFNADEEGIDPKGGKRVRTGTSGDDTLRGGPEDDTLRALGRDDRITAGAGDDQVDGGRGDDVLGGDAGRDNLIAGPGDDTVAGGPGHDVLIGGPGRDLLAGGLGPDWIVDTHGPTTVRTGAAGGRGRDAVNVRDGRGDDTVICGSRRSEVIADAHDRVRGDCGTVIRSGERLRLPTR